MRTLFWSCVLVSFLFPCVFAQDLAQLRKTIDDNTLKQLPADLGSGAVSQEIVDACKSVVEAANQIYALPGLDEQNRRWTLQRETIAQIILAYAGAPVQDIRSTYARLTVLSDELNQWGTKNFAKMTEEHVLRIGIVLATRTGNNAVNVDYQALAERMVMFVEEYPGSLQLIDIFLREVRGIKMQQYRDRRLAEIGPVFQDYFVKIHHQARADALAPDIRRATLPGSTMFLHGVGIDGNAFNPAWIRDKVVLIQFWGTWCTPCREEMPALIALYEKYRADDFEIIGINTGITGDDERKVRQFVDTTLFGGKKIPWRILHEGLSKRQTPNRETVSEYYGITELPVLILIGRDGKVLKIHPLSSALDSLVADATSLRSRFEWTEEEKKQMEENDRRRDEETDRLIQRAQETAPAAVKRD